MDDVNITTPLSWRSSSPTSQEELESLPAEQFANFLWRVASILLILLGTLGNGLSFLVMSRSSIRKTVTSLLLRALAVVDTCVLWTGYFTDWVLIVFDYDVRIQSEFNCRFQHIMFYWTFHYSAWILVLVTTERFISVVFPLKAKKIITKRTMVVCLITIGISLFILSSHFFWTQKLDFIEDGELRCVNDTETYDFWLSKIWPWIDLTVYSIIPFIIICTGNIAITSRVLISRKKTTGSTTSSTSTSSSEKSSQMTSMTTTLVCVSVIFLVTTLPYPFFVLVKSYSHNGEIDINTQAKEDLAWAVVNFAAYFNNAVNFLLYCLSSRLFRGQLTSMFCKKKVGPVPNANNSAG